jgi:hypothetical protein
VAPRQLPLQELRGKVKSLGTGLGALRMSLWRAETTKVQGARRDAGDG